MAFPRAPKIRRRFVWILALVAIGGSCAALLGFCLWSGHIQFNHPSVSRFPRRGIDISHHQGRIDWEQLSQARLDFVIAKATEGIDHKDTRFAEYSQAALATGHRLGAYHFYRMCREGTAQARHFLRTIDGIPLDMGTALDLEYGGNCQASGSREETIRQIHAFLDTVEQATGKPVMIYATAEFYEDWLQGDFAANPIWIRGIFREPSLSDGRGWTLWQYSARGRLDGIEGFVDLNAMR